MTTPAWMPPSLPEVEATTVQSKQRNVVPFLLVGACVLAFGLGALLWGLGTSNDAEALVEQPPQIVDSAIVAMTSGDWAGAYGQFDNTCAEFEPEALQAGFEPVLATYRSHDLNPLRARDFQPNEIVLVFGQIDLDNERQNPLRAEFVYAGDTVEQPWLLCGLRIDEP